MSGTSAAAVERPAAVDGSVATASATSLSLVDLAARSRALAAAGRRRLLGITGAPGAGKSTVCAALLNALGGDAVLVGMDGFHLANDELVRLGRRQRKGAPDTFDVDGYVALLRRLRGQSDDVVYAPRFDRGLEEAIGSAVAVRRTVPLVITEGNYLLLEDDGWQRVRSCLDEVWFLDTPADERVDRLVARRQLSGESTAAATSWVLGVDQVNAGRVETTADCADLVVRLTTDLRPHTTSTAESRSGSHPKEQR